jgi:hypothetical protein
MIGRNGALVAQFADSSRRRLTERGQTGKERAVTVQEFVATRSALKSDASFKRDIVPLRRHYPFTNERKGV